MEQSLLDKYKGDFMTVADIKEYIDKKLKQSREVRVVYDKHLPLIEALENIKYWLDELEDRPKAKWEETNCSTEYFGKLSRCSRCGYETFPQDDTNYCGGCGARMNDEVDNGSAN